jgi:hypothetical protein
MFLRDCVESYEQLEVALLLRAERDHPWTEEALSGRLGLSALLVAEALAGLQWAGLVDVRVVGIEKQYGYRLQSESVEAMIGRLAQMYREHPMPVIKLMTANAIQRVRTAALRTFADAFILRKDKNGS